MTYEEAKNVIGQCVGCKYLFDGECISENKCFDAKVKAIKALAKQIPTKLKGIYCPSCGFDCFSNAQSLFPKYCQNCGQALDYGEEK